MVVVAIIGVLAFLIALLVRSAQRPQTAGGGASGPTAQAPRWYEFTLALLLLAAIAAFVIWLISNGGQWAWGETFEDWLSTALASGETIHCPECDAAVPLSEENLARLALEVLAQW